MSRSSPSGISLLDTVVNYGVRRQHNKPAFAQGRASVLSRELRTGR